MTDLERFVKFFREMGVSYTLNFDLTDAERKAVEHNMNEDVISVGGNFRFTNGQFVDTEDDDTGVVEPRVRT